MSGRVSRAWHCLRVLPIMVLCAPVALATGALNSPDADVIQGGGHWFVMDDGSQNASVGMNNNGAQMHASVWLNRFSTASAITLDQLSIYWPGGLSGLTVNLVAYHDPDSDGDPSNAQRLGTNLLVQIGVQNAFQTWPVNFHVPGPGDFYVGFVDHWATQGSSPVRFPGALDTTAPRRRSYVAYRRGSEGITDINQLGQNPRVGTLETILPNTPSLHGNLMIRARSTQASAPDCLYANGFDTASGDCPS